jgi:uncharacterized membrane protein
MIPFIVLVSLFVLLTILGALHIPAAFGWPTALRLALAGMFFVTASAHWGKRRPDLVRMVPSGFFRPGLLVTLTGILELFGAIGLLLPAAARYAALGLALLLVAIFPANVNAARRGLAIAGRPVEPLPRRTVLQIVFLAATLIVFLSGPKG